MDLSIVLVNHSEIAENFGIDTVGSPMEDVVIVDLHVAIVDDAVAFVFGLGEGVTWGPFRIYIASARSVIRI